MQGRLTLLMGPPGGGKSTLLQLLAGLLAGHSVQVIKHVTDFSVTNSFTQACMSDDYHVPAQFFLAALQILLIFIIIYHLSFIIHHSSFIIHHSSFIIHHSSFIIYHLSFIFY